MKNAVIIGASSGIGEALTRILIGEGYRVAATGRRMEKLEALRQTNPDRIIPVRMDVRDTAATAAELDGLAARLGRIDLFVLSAGTGDLNSDLDFAVELDTIRTNVVGFTHLTDWCVRHFAGPKQPSYPSGADHRHTAKPSDVPTRPRLVFISSMAGLRGGRGAAAYNASKAYQINYIEGIRQKITHDKLQVDLTEIRPGFIDTSMAKGEGLFWVMPVEKAARQIYRAIRKRKSLSYLSRRWAVAAQLFKLLPRFLYNRM